MKRIWFWVRRILSISRGESNGLIILLPMVVLIMVMPDVVNRLTSSKSDFKDEKAQLEQLIAQLSVDSSSIYRDIPQFHFHPFDPNSITGAELQKMGVRDYVARNWEKYLSIGGSFNKPADVKKIYGLTDSVYNMMRPYIKIERRVAHNNVIKKEKSPENTEKHIFKKSISLQPFDLNEADTTLFKQIRGIGSVFSKRIVKYRDLLGGFVNKNQLKEVYGLMPEVLERLDSLTYINPEFTGRVLEINTLNEKDLSRHPYLSPRKSGAIIAYRYQHGNFSSAEDLYNIHTLDSLTIAKLKPYLKF